MFAYILMQYLIRSLNHPGTLNGLMQLDVGFTCFSVFCVASTASSLGIRGPTVARKNTKAAAWPLGGVTLTLGHAGVCMLTCALALVFAALMIIGMLLPCMVLSLDVQVLYDNGTIPANARGFVETLHLDALAHADVSIWLCIAKLVDWMGDGDINCLLAFVMLAVFVVGLTVLDMLILLFGAFHLQSHGTEAMAAAHVLRKLSMLDVCIVGVLVVVQSGSIYKGEGVILGIRKGLFALVGAELCHYAAYYLIKAAVEDVACRDVSRTGSDSSFEPADSMSDSVSRSDVEQ